MIRIACRQTFGGRESEVNVRVDVVRYDRDRKGLEANLYQGFDGIEEGDFMDSTKVENTVESRLPQVTVEGRCKASNASKIAPTVVLSLSSVERTTKLNPHLVDRFDQVVWIRAATAFDLDLTQSEAVT
jgi:hypothetical protein